MRANSIEYVPRPEVIDLKWPTYPNISASGTMALMTCAFARGFHALDATARDLKSPITSPIKASGTTTSTLHDRLEEHRTRLLPRP